MALTNEGEKESRLRIEKFINLLNEQNSVNSQETKNKLNLLQEVMEKEEKFKYDQRERDLEIYKNLFNTMTSKVSETVKLEIDARFQADMDNKSLAHTIAQRLMGEIDVLKRDIDKALKDTKESIKVNNNECSDRAHNISKYIDQQVSGNNEALLKKYENLKTLISKLTDQFKAHIIFHDEQLKNIQNKVKSQSDTSSLIKEELMNYTIGLEERYQKKFKDLTLYLEAIWKSNISSVNERVDILSNKTDKNFVLLSQELVDSRKVLANRIDEIDTTQTLQFKTIVEDLEGILTKMKNYDSILEKFEKNNETLNKKVETNIADIIGKVNTWQTNDKVTKNIAHQELLGEVDKVRDELTHFSQQVEQNMQNMIKNFENTYLSLFEKSKQTVEQITKMSENNYRIFNQIDNNIETLKEETRRIDIGTLMNSMLNKIEEENIYSVIDSFKRENLHQLEIIDNKFEKVEDSIRNVELNTIVQEMIGKVELSLIGDKLENINLKNDDSEKVIFTRLDLIDTKIQITSNNIEEVRNDLVQTKRDLSENVSKNMDSRNNSNLEISIANELINHYESKILLDNMLNKIEFDNIYSILNSSSANTGIPNDISNKLESFNERLIKIDNEITETTSTTKKVLNEYNSVIDSKVNNVMERLKKENIDMWTNSLKLENKTYTPEDIKKILKSIPPVIITREESKKMIKELEAIVEKNPRPKLISPWEKIITYKQDFQYDVLNNLKDSGEEELKAVIKKKKKQNMDTNIKFPKVNKQKNGESNENQKSGKNNEINKESPKKEIDDQNDKPKKELNFKDESSKEINLKKKNSEANLNKKVDENKDLNESKNIENSNIDNTGENEKKDINDTKKNKEQKEGLNKKENKKNK